MCLQQGCHAWWAVHISQANCNQRNVCQSLGQENLHPPLPLRVAGGSFGQMGLPGKEHFVGPAKLQQDRTFNLLPAWGGSTVQALSWAFTVGGCCHNKRLRESGLQHQGCCASNMHFTRVRSSRVARLRCCHCQLRQFASVQATHLEDTPRAAQAAHHDLSRCVAY